MRNQVQNLLRLPLKAKEVVSIGFIANPGVFAALIGAFAAICYLAIPINDVAHTLLTANSPWPLVTFILSMAISFGMIGIVVYKGMSLRTFRN